MLSPVDPGDSKFPFVDIVYQCTIMYHCTGGLKNFINQIEHVKSSNQPITALYIEKLAGIGLPFLVHRD